MYKTSPSVTAGLTATWGLFVLVLSAIWTRTSGAEIQRERFTGALNYNLAYHERIFLTLQMRARNSHWKSSKVHPPGEERGGGGGGGLLIILFTKFLFYTYLRDLVLLINICQLCRLCVCVCVHVCVRACLRVCVCVWDRERESGGGVEKGWGRT